MRRIFVAALLVATACVAGGQSAPGSAGHSWSRLQSTPAGTGLHIAAKGHTHHCTLVAVTEDALTCGSAIYPRADVRYVKVRHRGRSALAAAGIGAVAGGAGGAAAPGSLFTSRGAAVGDFAGIGAIIGAVIGASTDFTHSTIYQAP